MTRPASSLADWLVRLESFSPHEIDLGLDRVRVVLDRLDPRYPACVLHVAGTNGKGSTVAMAESLLSMSVAGVGTYTSPHIHRFNERIRIAGVPARDEEIVEAFARVESSRGDVPLTYFEFGTLAALLVFETRRVDVAILEIGMGGRLDAVNAIEPVAGLITNVSLDHCDWLGKDIESIAREKAGIMRRGRPTVFASTEVPESIRREADRIGADLVLAGRDYRWQRHGGRWNWTGRAHSLAGLDRPSLRGEMQIGNAAGVLALLECAGFDACLDAATVNAAFSRVELPGRMQIFRSDRQWVLDVAHNPAASGMLAAALADTTIGQGTPQKTLAIVGMLDDKDVAGMIAPLGHIVDRWIAVAAASPRSIPADELARRIANATNEACLEAASVAEAIGYAREFSGEGDRILVTGSFYTVGPAMQSLGLYSPG